MEDKKIFAGNKNKSFFPLSKKMYMFFPLCFIRFSFFNGFGKETFFRFTKEKAYILEKSSMDKMFVTQTKVIKIQKVVRVSLATLQASRWQWLRQILTCSRTPFLSILPTPHESPP